MNKQQRATFLIAVSHSFRFEEKKWGQLSILHFSDNCRKNERHAETDPGAPLLGL